MYVLKTNIYFMKKISKFLASLLLLPVKVLAQGGNASSTPPPAAVPLENPLGAADVSSFTANVIQGVLGIVGVLALLYFVLGGLQWLTSQGNQDKVKRGRETLIWATFGLAMIFFSYIVVEYVLKTLIS